MGPIQRNLVKGVMVVVAWPRLTLSVCAALAIVCIVLAKVFLSISTDENKLFDRDVKFFKDYLQFTEEFPENEAILIVLRPTDDKQPPPAVQWMALADEITARLQAMPQYVKSVQSHIPLEKLGNQAMLFENWDGLKEHVAEAGEFAPLVQTVAGRPGFAEMLLGKTPVDRLINGQVAALALRKLDGSQVAFMGAVADSWKYALENPNEPLKRGKGIVDLAAIQGELSPRDYGYSYIPDEVDPKRHLMLIDVYEKEDSTSLQAASEHINAMRAAVQTIAAGYPQFKVDFTGRPVIAADELKVSDDDNFWAECCAIPLIFIGLAVMLRSWWLALVAEITLGIGIAWTFGWALLAVGQLNLLSLVFVIALIGIGMDYLIQILTRYRHESFRYARPSAIWARVFRYTSPPISTACLGAAGAFLVSKLTPFQGASELGLIAGGGLILCLVAGYTVLPAILVLWPMRRQIDPEVRYDDRPEPSAGGWRLIVPMAWIVLLIVGIPLALKTDFDPDLLNLQPQGLEAVKLVHSLPCWYAVVASSDQDVLRKAQADLNQVKVVASTDSLLDAFEKQKFLARDPNVEKLRQIVWTKPVPPQAADLPRWGQEAGALADSWAAQKMPANDYAALGKVVATLNKVAQLWSAGAQEPAVATRMADWQEKFVAELRDAAGKFMPGPVDIAALPAELRNHYISQDGRKFALYIYPKKDLWNNDYLKEFVREVEHPLPREMGVTGIAIQFYHSTEAIRKAFMDSTLYAIVLIVILVYLDLRNVGQTLRAVSVLALGLPILLELMVLLGIKWNFANFFGLPILIGAGHEYGVFMMHRYKEVLHDPRRVWRRWDVSDRALLLCAFVTCASFGFMAPHIEIGSFSLGRHVGMASLGKVMALGIACIYLATLLVLRPLLVWRLKQRKVYGHLDEKNQ